MISHRILPTKFGDVASGKTHVANGKSLAEGSCDARQRSNESLSPALLWGGFLKMVGFPNNHGFFLLKMISTWGVKYGGTRHLRKQPYGNLISLPTSSLRKIKCPMYSQYILPAPFSASPAGNFDRSHFHHGLFQVQLRKLLPSTKIAHEDFSHGKLVPKMCPKWYTPEN